MRIALDLTALLPQPTGVDVFMIRLVQALARLDGPFEYTVYVNRGDAERLGSLPDHFRVRVGSLRSRAVRLAFQQVALPASSYLHRFDVVHSPSFFCPLWRGAARHVLTIHDLTSFTRPGMHTRVRGSLAYRTGVHWSARRADAVMVPSRYVAEQFAQVLPDVDAGKVVVVPEGVGPEFRPAVPGSGAGTLARLGVRGPYILCVSTVGMRKGIDVLLAAYERLLAKGCPEQLVLAGKPGTYYAALLERIRSPALRGQVVLTGYVAKEDLPPLYAGARLFVYPSREEGFGLPPLEAMASGVPTIASDGSSLRENLAGAAELTPPEDVAALADAMERCLREPRRRERLVAAGVERAARFTWERTAQSMAALYARLASAPGAGGRRASSQR